MSGTSLDGVDIAYCELEYSETDAPRNKKEKSLWKFKIVAAETIPFTTVWQTRLREVENTNALSFSLTHVDFGHYLGHLVTRFIKKKRLHPQLVASHGHTIFHQPGKALTTQIGDGAAIAAECGLPVVCDFRSKDVALGGQGAPLVPIGDELLFSEYDFCLNLGGFANISFRKSKERRAFDVCPVNIVLNELSKKLGKKYDDAGELARRGAINESLFKQLNALNYFRQAPPKSLGKEWVLTNFLPLIAQSGVNPFDGLRTVVEHIGVQIARALNTVEKKKTKKKRGTLLVTGGGAYNTFLIERIQFYTRATICLPDKNTIEFKEALIFGLLGILRWRNEVNCLKSVTGAKKDSSGGCIYM